MSGGYLKRAVSAGPEDFYFATQAQISSIAEGASGKLSTLYGFNNYTLISDKPVANPDKNQLELDFAEGQSDMILYGNPPTEGLNFYRTLVAGASGRVDIQAINVPGGLDPPSFRPIFWNAGSDTSMNLNPFTSSFNVNAPNGVVSATAEISSLQVSDELFLDEQRLTATSNELLLNGVPITTTSNLAQWAQYPASQNVDLSGNDLLNANLIEAVGVSSIIMDAHFGNFSSIRAYDITAENFTALSTINTFNFLSSQNIFTDDINTSTLTAQTAFISSLEGSEANISTINVFYIIARDIISTPDLEVSSINGHEVGENTVTISSITTDFISSVGGTFAEILTSNLSFTPTISPQVQFPLTFDFGSGLAIAGAGIGAFLGGVLGVGIGVAGGIGNGIYQMATGIAGAVAPRFAFNVNSNNFETINATTQLQFSTLGTQISTIYRFQSTILSSIYTSNDVPLPPEEYQLEVFFSTISSPPPVYAIRSIGDPLNLVSSPQEYYQAFGQWVEIPPEIINFSTFTTLDTSVVNTSTINTSTINVTSIDTSVVNTSTINTSTIRVQGVEIQAESDGSTMYFYDPANGDNAQLEVKAINLRGDPNAPTGIVFYQEAQNRLGFIDSNFPAPTATHTLAYINDSNITVTNLSNVMAYVSTGNISTVNANFVSAGKILTDTLTSFTMDTTNLFYEDALGFSTFTSHLETESLVADYLGQSLSASNNNMTDIQILNASVVETSQLKSRPGDLLDEITVGTDFLMDGNKRIRFTTQGDIRATQGITLHTGVGETVNMDRISTSAVSTNTMFVATDLRVSSFGIHLCRNSGGSGVLGLGNVAIGPSALESNVSGQNNVALAQNAMRATSNGSFNVAVGVGAGRNIGNNNVCVGLNAGGSNALLNINNVAIGTQAGAFVSTNTTVNGNVLIGFTTGSNVHGLQNVIIGANAGGEANEQNVCIGTGAGSRLAGGGGNLFLGQNAGSSNSVRRINATGFGNASLRFNYADRACGFGIFSGESNIGAEAIAVGSESGRSNLGQFSIALGARANEQGGSLASNITLNATGLALNNSNTGSLVVKPIRLVAPLDEPRILHYDSNSGEISHSQLSSISIGGFLRVPSISTNSISTGLIVADFISTLGLSTNEANIDTLRVNALSTNNISTNNISSSTGSIDFLRTTAVSTATMTITNDLQLDSLRVKLGLGAGEVNQSAFGIAVGRDAGKFNQDTTAMAIGFSAGNSNQGEGAVAVGRFAGQRLQGQRATAVGASAGNSNQGQFAVAIGEGAGTANQASNSIVINAGALALQNTVPNSFVVKPLRGITLAESDPPLMSYDSNSGEISYSNITALNLSERLTAGSISTNTISTNVLVADSISTFSLAVFGDNTLTVEGNSFQRNISAGNAYVGTLSSANTFISSLSSGYAYIDDLRGNTLVADSISTNTISANTAYVSTLSSQYTVVENLIVKNLTAENASLANTFAIEGVSTINADSNNFNATLDLNAFSLFDVFSDTAGVANITITPSNIQTGQLLYFGIRNQTGGNISVAFSANFKNDGNLSGFQNNRQIAFTCISFGSNVYELSRSGIFAI